MIFFSFGVGKLHVIEVCFSLGVLVMGCGLVITLFLKCFPIYVLYYKGAEYDGDKSLRSSNYL